MNYYTDSAGYITGWGHERDDPVEAPWPEMQGFRALYDGYGNPIYRLVDGRIVKAPQPPSPEQAERERKARVRGLVAQTYSIEDRLDMIEEVLARLDGTFAGSVYRQRVIDAVSRAGSGNPVEEA